MTAPLDDIRIIEVDNWMAAPSAGAVLADLGAEVIKVEPLSGDPMRGKQRKAKVDGPLRDYDLQFDVDNRGKKSIAIALDKPEGAELVRHLVRQSQVFLCNLLTHRQKKFGMDPETLLKVNPKLVHATFTGYGTEGPDAWRPGFDVTAFFGRSGLYDAMREGAHGEVPQARPAQGDHTAGLALVGAILAGLRLAERTGEGQVVETSLYESAVWTQASDYGVTAVDKAPVRQRSRREVIIPLGNRYPCGDGKWVVFNMPDPQAWPKFCRIIERDDWITDERYKDAKGRFDHMAELVDGIDEALSARTRDEWGEIFDSEGLIWGPVLGIHEVAADPQAEAINLFPTLHHDRLGVDYRTVSIPMRFQGSDVGPKGPAPDLGQHTRDVLTEVGLSEAEIQSLTERAIVG